MERKMKKLLLALLILIFASPASATVYKWVDQRGVVNFADDYSKVPPNYRNKAEELNLSKTEPSTPSQTQAPPIAQTLTREGDFAIKLAEALKIGQAKSEAEAESMLASAGIAPKNGWIADYPMTPDIIGELENAVGEAADAKRLSMSKNEALKVLRTIAVEFELPIIAEIPEGYTESPPPTTPQYTPPSLIENYYYAEGPPVITYYPPPWDYYYMYAWVPTPFWCSGFYFPGFFILHDFHRVFHRHGHVGIISNHIRDNRTGRFYAIDPVRRRAGMISGGRDTPSVRGFNSSEARNGARLIFQRSRERVAPANVLTPTTTRGLRNRSPSDLRSGRSTERQVYNRENRLSGFNDRNGAYGRPPAIEPRMSRTPGETRSRGIGDMTFNRRDNMNRQSGSNFQRPPTGQTRSFSPPSPGGERFSSPRGSERSFSPSPQGGTSNRTFSQPNSMSRQNGMNFQRPSSSETRSSSPLSRSGERSFSSHPQGGGQHYSSPPVGSRSFSGSPQGGNRGSSFGQGGPRF